MSTLKVALLQMSACGCDQAAHLAKGEAFCRQAAAMGADLALFPEMWNTGYTSAHPWAPDPVAFDKQGSRDTLVIEAGESEGVYLATFAMDAIRDYRQREVGGGAFRRPQRHAALAVHDVKEPFIRVSPAGARFDETQQ